MNAYKVSGVVVYKSLDLEEELVKINDTVMTDKTNVADLLAALSGYLQRKYRGGEVQLHSFKLVKSPSEII